ncbi:hypothetical protein ACTWQB_09900, partial [Piscibacillus sp. B03]
QNFNATIQKAYEQSLEIKKSINKSDAIYYDSDKKKTRNKVIDLSRYKSENVLMISVTLSSYLNLATSLHLFLNRDEHLDSYPFAVDFFTLENILEECLKRKEPELFINFVKARVKEYGSTFSLHSSELDYFGYFLKNKNFIQGGNKGLYTTIGSGYSSFVIDESKDNYEYPLKFLKDLIN